MKRENAIVGQSGGPTAAINATLAGIIAGVRESGAFGTLYGAYNGVEGMLSERFCDLNGKVSQSDLALLRNTPAAALGSCRLKLAGGEQYDRLFALFDKLDIGSFFYIGGNDSMDTVAQLSAEAEKRHSPVRFIGVPKTIDNDLILTDHTPGYGSAAKFVATTLREIRRDCAVYTKPAVTVVEIMGRDSGWLTAAAALTDVDGLYLPERVFDTGVFLADVKQALARHPDVLIAVSEGIRDKEGSYIGAAGHKGLDIFGHVNLSGAGKALELFVKEQLGVKVRSVELSVLQRCAAHIASETDLNEGEAVGRAAVRAALEGKSGVMAAIIRTGDAPYTAEITTVDAAKVANQAKVIPDEWINERGNGVNEACVRYIRPLIVGEPALEYEDGLPKQFVLPRG